MKVFKQERETLTKEYYIEITDETIKEFNNTLAKHFVLDDDHTKVPVVSMDTVKHFLENPDVSSDVIYNTTVHCSIPLSEWLLALIDFRLYDSYSKTLSDTFDLIGYSYENEECK